MPAARRVFFPFLAERFPDLLKKYEERYTRNAYLRGEYSAMIGARVRAIRARYGLDNGPLEHMPAGAGAEQPWLFEIR
jgi:hypothetical protein